MKLPLVLLSTALTFAALPAHADRYVAPKNAAYAEECGACHLAFPPGLLDTRSWRAVMDGLPKHFGSDASLEEKRRLAITDFLVANAGGRKVGVTADATGRPLLRITETARFANKHREIDAATYRQPTIKSAANCAACHPRADAGDFEDDNVRIPR